MKNPLKNPLRIWQAKRKAKKDKLQQQLQNPQKILIIRFSSMGDIVLTSPVVRCLKNKFPLAELHVVCKDEYATVWKGNPYIFQVHVLRDGMSSLIENLKLENFDLIIDLHKNVRSKRIAQALAGQYFTFDKLNFKKWLTVNFKVKVLPHISIVDRYFQGLQKLQVANDGKGLDFFISEKEKISINKDLPMSHSHGYIACVIGGTYFTKKMPAEKWLELCQMIPFPIIIVGGKEDKEIGDWLAENVDGKKVYNSSGKFSLHESADIIRHARMVISHDTGMMHIAASFQKEIITIWGNTIPDFGMFPYYGNSNIRSIDSQVEVSCRPCSKIGFNHCPKGHFKCMQKQNLNKILEDVKKNIILANLK